MKSAFLVLLSMIWVATASGAELLPNDFAFKIPLEMDPGAAVYELAAPRQVYEKVIHPDLTDSAVFNGADRAVPYYVLSPETKKSAPPPVSVPVFPVFPEAGPGASDIRIQVESGAGRAMVKMNGRLEGAVLPTSYVLDLSGLKHPAHKLRLTWEKPENGFIAQMRVEAGDELDRMSIYPPDQALSDLVFGNHRLTRDTLRLPGRPVRYIRLTWTKTNGIPSITGATALFPAKLAWKKWEMAALSTRPDPKKNGVYLATSPGRFPVDYILAKLPEKNTLAKAALFSRDTQKGNWVRRWQGLLYNLEVQGIALGMDRMDTPVTADRFWKLEVDPSGGGLGDGPVGLELAWLPHRLRFVARGQGPFVLAYGRAGDTPPRAPAPGVLLNLDPEKMTGMKGKAKPGPPQIAGGEDQLVKKTPVNWKQAGLWVFLVSGVAFLAYMVFRLMGKMKQETDSP